MIISVVVKNIMILDCGLNYVVVIKIDNKMMTNVSKSIFLLSKRGNGMGACEISGEIFLILFKN